MSERRSRVISDSVLDHTISEVLDASERLLSHPRNHPETLRMARRIEELAGLLVHGIEERQPQSDYTQETDPCPS